MSEELIPYMAKRKAGRPSEYKPEYCEQMVQYFLDCMRREDHAIIKTVYEESTQRGKTMRQERGSIMGDVPTFQRFAISVGVIPETIIKWGKAWPEFAEAIKTCKTIQEDYFVQGLASGRIPAQGGIFVAKNLTKFVDDTGITVAQTHQPTERPALADRTPQQLEGLKAAMLAAEALGFRLTLDDTSKDDPPQDTRKADQ